MGKANTNLLQLSSGVDTETFLHRLAGENTSDLGDGSLSLTIVEIGVNLVGTKTPIHANMLNALENERPQEIPEPQELETTSINIHVLIVGLGQSGFERAPATAPQVAAEALCGSGAIGTGIALGPATPVGTLRNTAFCDELIRTHTRAQLYLMRTGHLLGLSWWFCLGDRDGLRR